MTKIVTVATVAVVLVGIGLVTSTLIRTSGQFGRIGAAIPEPREEAARAPEPRATERIAPPAALPPADADEFPAVAEPSADESSPFGHATEQQVQPDHESTIAEGPPTDAAGDAKSLAPLLADAHATLTQLLADAERDPDAKAELAALIGDSAPFEDLLEDPDPAVRREAARLREVLGLPAQSQ